METKSQNLIRQIKEIKQQKKLSYNDIIEALPKRNGVPVLSLTTIRRVCANGSESRASSFNYEETLLPLSEAVKSINSSEKQVTETELLKNVILLQTEELNRLIEIKEHLESTVAFLTEQFSEKDKLIKRLIDRLDQKDEIIQQFINDMKRKDAIVDRLIAE